MITNPKFNIGDFVFIYYRGKLYKREVDRVRIIVDAKEVFVSYQFKPLKGFPIWEFWDSYTDEKEVYASKEEYASAASQITEA